MEINGRHQPLVLLGSARKGSDTSKLVERLFAGEKARVLDLLDYKICHYNYSGSYPPDDSFQALVQELLAHPVLVFATPIYWYSMSGHMKVFFDRLTDLVSIAKKQGRQLKGKKVFLMAVGTDDALPEGFEVPFRRTARYLDMEFIASCYFASAALEAPLPAEVHAFLKKILALTGEN
ncbi:NADPH-dependent FMN reductase [Flammeovirgaceae bacterium 311]|nr:NADPH-dependent FMN reductase [Flammeovirgaceae bacterium 311]